MKRMTLLLVAGLCLLAAGTADARWRGRMYWGGCGGCGWYGWHPWPYAYSFYYDPLIYAPSVNPDLATVDTDISPGHTRLYLDGEFIGTSDHFDGLPGFLYLGPGRYTLEARLGGYETQTMDLEVHEMNSYRIELDMKRIPDQPRESFWDRDHRPEAFTRVYRSSHPLPPLSKSRGAARPGGGPDLSLRPDLDSRAPAGDVEGRIERNGARDQGQRSPTRTEATISFKIRPANAAVYLDGQFLGTAGELERAHRPMLMAPGSHTLEVLAPGLDPSTRSLELKPGQDVQINLDAAASTPVEPEPDHLR
jgi:hypothetical protein